METRTINEHLSVTTMGLGGTGLGNIYQAVDTGEAIATVNAACDEGVRYFDTEPPRLHRRAKL